MQGTVVLATRDRPEQCSRALGSLLADLPPNWIVIVVDQSANDDTAGTVERLIGEGAPLRLIRSPRRRGLSCARNDGCSVAEGELLLFTDDDCLAPPGWVRAWGDAFIANPRMGIGFGPVTCPPYDSASGHTPTFDPGAGLHLHSSSLFRAGVVEVGMGANMAMRRRLFTNTCHFDERLGAGCRHAGAEETDIAYRLARLGWLIGHVPGPAIDHHGFRPRAEASRLSQAYGLGTGAMYAKHIRQGDLFAVEIAGRETLRLLWKILHHAATGRRPMGIRALHAYLLGMISSTRLPLDRDLRVYRPATTSDRSWGAAPAGQTSPR